MTKPKANYRGKQKSLDALYELFAGRFGLSAEDLAFIKKQREEYELGQADSKEPEKAGEKSHRDILALIRFSAGHPPPTPVPLFSLAGQTIATAENLMAVQAKMKAGKSAAIGAMIAATMNPEEGECLHFKANNADGKAVLHFDTEQSRYDHHRLLSRSLHRAGRGVAPSWLYSYHIKGFGVDKSKELLLAAMEMAAEECGGIYCSIVDGVADLCADVNDAAEANGLVAEMESLAVRYSTLMCCVLHENQSSDNGKMRGHLGSQLARKAETNLRLEKNADGLTLMFADTSRSVFIGKKQAPGFKWCDEAKMHVPVMSIVGMTQAKQQFRMMAVECFSGVTGGLSWSELQGAIMRETGFKDKYAEKAIGRMVKEFSLIEKRDERYFPL